MGPSTVLLDWQGRAAAVYAGALCGDAPTATEPPLEEGPA